MGYSQVGEVFFDQSSATFDDESFILGGDRHTQSNAGLACEDDERSEYVARIVGAG
ncbi:MAG: hypothetical protein R2795_24590 [Saprospiraceae bacterium]